MLNFKSVNIITSLVLIGLLITYTLFSLSSWWIFLLFFTWLTLTALGSGLIGWNYHVKSLNFNPKITENYISITFDDGPNPEFTNEVLKLLKKHQAKATFFCIGKHIALYPDLFKKIIHEGHTVGNHTYSHDNAFGFFKTQTVEMDLRKTNRIVTQLTGLNLKLYRPAFGVTNPRIRRAVQSLQLTSIGWNKRSLDTTNLSQKAILKRVTKDLKKGDVILLHDTNKKTLQVLEQLLLFLKEKNLQSVSIDTLFNIQAYA